MFLTPQELQQLTGYAPHQRKRTCRWLEQHGIAHTTNRLGDPVVLRSTIEQNQEAQIVPNFDWLKKSA